MKQKLFGFFRPDRRGLALISVLGVVTLATILILSLYSISDSEFKASVVYTDAATARHLADAATNIVIGQIQAAATGSGSSAATGSNSAPLGSTIWASQPGAVRVYNSSGAFIQGRTLYSSSKMVWDAPNAAGERKMTENVPDAQWAASLDQWVDLNRPVVRANSAPGGGSAVYFPIFDPRALQPAPGSPNGKGVEGFEILPKTTGLSSVSSKDLGVNVNAGPPDTWRLPTPVEWLYMLRDGSVGTVRQPASGQGKWIAVNNVQPTDINPIIGRVGFWTDDECCKININTAGEPGYWSQPTAMHERERSWADSPPAIFEYQRFPGHPATVALSSVFAPGFDPKSYQPSDPAGSLTYKNSVYDFVPQLVQSPTNDGRLPFPNDIMLGGSQEHVADITTLRSNMANAKKEPLFTSVDEAMFNSGIAGGSERTERHLVGPTGSELITPQLLERYRAFLTTRSRAPETNMFGLPRVAIWPVPDTSTPTGGSNFKDYRTGFDSAVAICAKLGSTTNNPLLETANSYYFRRQNASSHLTDMGRDPKGGNTNSGLGRNNSLMNYLDQLVKMKMPGGSSFNTKYSNGDAQQILVEIFDYIRCTNLYDSFLAKSSPHSDDEQRDDSLGAASKLTQPITTLWDQAPAKGQYYTYTPPRFRAKRKVGDEGLGALSQFSNLYTPEWLATGSYPGHGQVKPIEWADSTGRVFKGFGRFPTISEVGLHFICTGDGQGNDKSSVIIRAKDGSLKKSGGKAAERILGDRDHGNDRWCDIDTLRFFPTGDGQADIPPRAYYYSNIPPYPGADLFFNQWGCRPEHTNQNDQWDVTRHPGWFAQNWNCTLEYDAGTRSGVPLAEDEKRIQICLLIETFVPAVGYTRFTPDFTIVLRPDQVSGIKVQDAKGAWRSVFSTTDPHLVVQSTYAFSGEERGLNAPKTVSPLGGHFAPDAITKGRQVASTGKMPKDPSFQQNATGNIHSAMLNFPLVSNFITVKRGDGISGVLKFKVEKPLAIDIYATHDWQGTLDPANAVPSQTVNIQFPTGEQGAPVPDLVVYSTERYDRDVNGSHTTRDAVPAPHWWCFNFQGALNRYSGTGDPGSAAKGEINFNNVKPVTFSSNTGFNYIYGRFCPPRSSASNTNTHDVNSPLNTDARKDPNNPGHDDPAYQGPAMPYNSLIYGYSNFGEYAGVLSRQDDKVKTDFYQPGDYVKSYKDIREKYKAGTYAYYGSDTVRSIIPRHGDYRILAARKVVDANTWAPHPVWLGTNARGNALFAHSFTGAYSDAVVGFDLGGKTDTDQDPKFRLVPGAYYDYTSGTEGTISRSAVIPDTPLTKDAAAASITYRDFDNGPGNLRDGPYINKPDDGSLGIMQFWHGNNTGAPQGFYVVRNTYFMSSFLQLPATDAYFTPNRVISSPGMFGSLPTGVWGSQAGHAASGSQNFAGTDGIPWRTLLFRADVDGHVGAPPWAATSSTTTTPGGGGGVAPADHYFMDLFFMPVVEPYAITDSYSTAGKINLNYQIVPFTNIKRATALYAALKGEMITAYSSADTAPTKSIPPGITNTAIYKKIKDVNPLPQTLWNDNDVRWHREIDVPETLVQFDERFSFNGVTITVPGGTIGPVGLMLSPSTICEMHLIPKYEGPARTGKLNVPQEPPTLTGLTYLNRSSTMNTFWRHNDLTGDNTRERPYANLYQKFTTRSNVFQIYFTAQTLRKARSLGPATVDTHRDTVTSELRGSAIIERYLDFSKTGSAELAKNDYGASASLTSMKSLEQFYHYRVIEMKQFAP